MRAANEPPGARGCRLDDATVAQQAGNAGAVSEANHSHEAPSGDAQRSNELAAAEDDVIRHRMEGEFWADMVAPASPPACMLVGMALSQRRPSQVKLGLDASSRALCIRLSIRLGGEAPSLTAPFSQGEGCGGGVDGRARDATDAGEAR